MTWAELTGTFLMAVVLIFLPGFLVLASWRVPLFVAISCAPNISFALLAGSAILAGFANRFWGLPWLLGATIAACLLGLVYRLFIRLKPSWASKEAPSIRQQWTIIWPYLLSTLVMSLLYLPRLLSALQSPEHFAQRYDNAFHLNVIHWVAVRGGGSSLELNQLGSSRYYPTAWHDWAGLAARLSDVNAIEVSQACGVVMVLLVWPLSMIWLTEILLKPDLLGRLLFGAMISASSTFPLCFIFFGTLYPNLVGLAIAPPIIAAALEFLLLAKTRFLCRSLAVLAGIATLCGALLAHPNAVLIAGAAVLPLIFWRVFSLLKPYFKKPRLTPVRKIDIFESFVLLFFSAAFCGVWLLSAIKIPENPWIPALNVPNAVGEVAFGTDMGRPPIYLLSIGLIAGFIWLVADKNVTSRLTAFCFGLLGFLYVATNAFSQGIIRNLISAPFYSDAYRTGAAPVLLAIPIAIFGWQRIICALKVKLNAADKTISTEGKKGFAISAVIVVALTAGVIWSPGMTSQLNGVRDVFAITPDAQLLSQDEYDLLKRVDDYVPAGQKIAVNPYQGAGLVYAIADRDVTQLYFKSIVTPDVDTVNDELNEVASDPKVCTALHDLGGVHYALQLEPRTIYGFAQDGFFGFHDLADHPGFKLLDQQGQAKLFEITACK